MSEITFQEYQQKAYTAVQEHQDTRDELLNWIVGMSEEVGELSNIVKHELWCSEEHDIMAYAKELGDLLWYIMALCTVLDINFDTVAELNIAKTTHRYPERRFDASRSYNRHSIEREFECTEVYQELCKKIHLKGE